MLLVLPAQTEAQEEDPQARVDPATGALDLALAPLLDDGGLRRALHSGLPIRVEVTVELWRDGFFDQQEAGGTWRASILHDAVTQSYEFQAEDQEPISLPTLDRVAQTLQSAFESEVRPRREGRYYYLAEVEMQTLSLSDLEELRRWLQGDLGSVVEGDGSPETAVARGLRRIMVRALRLPARRERLQTPSFDWPPKESETSPPEGPAGRSRTVEKGSPSDSALPSLPPPGIPEIGLDALLPPIEPFDSRGNALPVDSSGFPCAGPTEEPTG
ncbi:MAG: hypothetical protein P8188_00375 [Gemmatimonadota bacterium]